MSTSFRPDSPDEFMHFPAFSGAATFAHLPMATALDGLDVGIIGVPFDTGTTFRVGGRMAPRAIRAASAILGPYNSIVDTFPFRVLSCADLGDIPVVPGNSAKTFDAVASHLRRATAAGVVPLLLGGDHSCTLAHLRGLAVDRPVALVQFDSHTDLADDILGERYCHGTWLRRAIEEGLVDVEHSIQIGLRGSIGGPEVYDDVKHLGLTFLTTAEARRNLVETADVVRARVAGRPAFLTFDMDVVDPAFAPGVGSPEPGGFASWEIVDIIQRLHGIPFVGFDIVEMIPAYDPSEITALLAATVAFELLSQHSRERSRRDMRESEPDSTAASDPRRVS